MNLSEECWRRVLPRVLVATAALFGTIVVASVNAAPPVGQSTSAVGIRVLDAETRQPLERFMLGVSYHVASRTGQDRHVRISRIIRDAEGSYVLTDLPRAAVFIAVRAPGLGLSGYGHAVRMIITGGDAPTEVEFLLERSVSFRGEVVDRIGLPVSGATITVEYQDRLKEKIAQSVLDQARLEGLTVSSIEAPEQYGPHPFTRFGADEEKPVGDFYIRGVDGGRPLQLVARHEELGIARSEIMTPEPGTDVTGIQLQYQ